MSKPLIAERKGHPKDIRITDALKEDDAARKASKGLITKTATLVTAGISDGELKKLVGESMEPTGEQLERINRFTRRSVSAEEVVCFNTLSCNDQGDRDDDQFSTQCVKDFAELEQPFSPVGKNFMLDHSYTTDNAVGRIFGVDAQKIGGTTWLTNEVYLPNTEQFQPLIEKIDFGIAWAVSVGVVLGKAACTVCEAGFSYFGYWCRNGHDKGAFYDPTSEEEDEWGYPIPCEPNDPKAVKCLRQFSEPRDFYELSQVFLGAQYDAALADKAPEMAGLIKTAGGSFIGASQEEARKLPLRHEPEKLSEARTKFEVKEIEDGSLTWTDDQSLVWVFDPEDSESGVVCLGKSSEASESEEDVEDASGTRGSGTDEESSSESGGSDGSESDATEDGAGESSDQSSASGQRSSGSEGSSSELDEEDDDEEEEKSLSKSDVLKVAKSLKLNSEWVKAAEDGEGNGLNALLLAMSAENEQLRTEKKELSEKAVLGDAYLKELRSEAIDWYVKAHSPDSGINTDTFERMLDRFDNDVDLYRSVIEENKNLAREKFPKEVRRSSFPIDVNERQEVEEPTFHQENAERVKRIHG